MVENNPNDGTDTTFSDLLTERLSSIDIENNKELLQIDKLGINSDAGNEEIFSRCIVHQVYPEENLKMIDTNKLKNMLNIIAECLNGDCKDTIIRRFEKENPNKRDINNFSTRIKTNLPLESFRDKIIEDIISYSVISSFERKYFFDANKKIFLGQSPTEVLEDVCNE